jgi:hypothetical protein
MTKQFLSFVVEVERELVEDVSAYLELHGKLPEYSKEIVFIAGTTLLYGLLTQQDRLCDKPPAWMNEPDVGRLILRDPRPGKERVSRT